jgi:hypothetical protein
MPLRAPGSKKASAVVAAASLIADAAWATPEPRSGQQKTAVLVRNFTGFVADNVKFVNENRCALGVLS